ncbi:MAG: type IV secretion system protein [Rickettsiales bacterium]
MNYRKLALLPNHSNVGAWQTTLTVLLAIAVVCFVPNPAFAGAIGEFLGFFTGSSFYCSDDLGPYSPLLPSLPVGDLYDNGIADCASLGIEHIFSGFVCQFEHLVDDIFSQLYCGIQHYIQVPLSAFLTLFIVFIGVGFLTSYLQFTAKEVVMILFKIALVWALATQSDFMISYVFNGFIFFMQSSVYYILQALSPMGTTTLSPNNGLFGQMDKIINDIVANSVSASMVDGTDAAGNPIKVPSFMGGTCKDDPLKIILAIGISMPPLFMIMLMTFIKLVMVLLRTLLGYLLCITGVMFLLTFAPIFLALGMFRITQGYFASWLQLLIGFSTQVFIMFAFLAVAIGLFANSQFSQYQDLVMEWGQEYMHDSIRGGLPKPTGATGFFCTLCEPDPATMDISFSKDKQVKCKEPKTAIPPTALYSNGAIIELLGVKIFMLALIAYLFESILNLAPEVASKLSKGIGVMGSANSSPPITTGGVSAVPGKGHIQSARKAVKLTAQSGQSGSIVTDALRTLLIQR